MHKGITRRDFLTKASVVTGSTYTAMMALGLLKAAPAAPLKVSTSAVSSSKKIIIIGAGLSGMTAAYELGKLGYQCTVLEARSRAGGRVWTVRKGTKETEIGGSEQQCNFEDGNYLNAGAARIPHHHEISLKYCKELGIPLEVFTNVNEAAFYYSAGKGPLANKSIPIRQIHSDFKGYSCELLAKAIDQKALDLPLSDEDIVKLIEYLRAEGDLDINKFYKGSERRGYKNIPGAGNTLGTYTDPYQLREIVYSGFTQPAFQNVGEYTYNQQPIMLQPVGGMDKLPKALEKKVKDKIIYDAETLEIRKMGGGVNIVYKNKKDNKSTELQADYCICTVPLPVLNNIKNDFSEKYKKAFGEINYMNTGKIGLQFKRRFWEEDDHIFGGISKTNMNITQIFYPSYGYLSNKGVLVGYYHFHQMAQEMGNLTLAEREKKALTEGAKIHPQYTAEFENSFSLAWQKIPYSQGGWASYSSITRDEYYSTLIEPDGPLYLAGEHTTYLTAWMAGAFESARRVTELIHEKATKS